MPNRDECIYPPPVAPPEMWEFYRLHGYWPDHEAHDGNNHAAIRAIIEHPKRETRDP